MTILPLCYFPPLSWFKAWLSAEQGSVLVERHEHFPKQTYRNRCHIHSPNGLLVLSIPVQHGSRNHTAVKDVRISPYHPWQKIHWRSLEAAYRSSAFFEFYEDELRPFYERKYEFLFDYNEQLLRLVLGWFGMEPDCRYTDEYIKTYPPGSRDYRSTIHPKSEPVFKTPPYYQVFEDRNGFLPDLSIIDLLFSQGPRAPGSLK